MVIGHTRKINGRIIDVRPHERNNNNRMILYHGSNREIRKFDIEHINNNSNDEEGVGIYLTDSIDEAKHYGKFIHVVELNSYKKVPLKGKVNIKHVRELIRLSPERETSLSN